MSQLSVFVELNNEVKQLVENSQINKVIRNSVVQKLAQTEIDRRVDLLVTAFKLRKSAENAVNKMKPDVVYFNADGSKYSESFSKAKIDELNKAKSKLAKIDKAVSAAVDEANYELVSNLEKGDDKSSEDKQT